MVDRLRRVTSHSSSTLLWQKYVCGNRLDELLELGHSFFQSGSTSEQRKLASAGGKKCSTAMHTLTYEDATSCLLLQTYRLSSRADMVGTGGPRRT